MSLVRSFIALLITPFLAGLLGWSSAAAQPPTLIQWVRLDNGGRLSGTVSSADVGGSVRPVAAAEVVLAGRPGETFRATADVGGRFTFNGLEPGVYSLSARGRDVYACYALHLVGRDTPGADELPRQVPIVAARVPLASIESAVVRYLPSRPDPVAFDLGALQLDRLGDEVRQGSLLRVRQQGGGLTGQIRLPGLVQGQLRGAVEMNVFVFSEGVERGRAITDAEGNFRVENVTPGVYTLIAVGRGGIAVVGVDVVTETDALPAAAGGPTDRSPLAGVDTSGPGLGSDATTLVSRTQANASDGLIVQAAPLPILPETAPSQPVSGAAAAAGGGGGGGGGFGGGGFGGFGALAGIAAAAAIAGDSGDDSLFAPEPASPVLPPFLGPALR